MLEWSLGPIFSNRTWRRIVLRILVLAIVLTLVLGAPATLVGSGVHRVGVVGAAIIFFEMVSWTAVALGRKTVLPAIPETETFERKGKTRLLQVVAIVALVSVPPVAFAALLLPRITLLSVAMIVLVRLIWFARRRGGNAADHA